MNKHTSLLLIGILLILIPLSGFPSTWRSFFTICGGLAIVVIGLSLYREKHGRLPFSVHSHDMPAHTRTYIENSQEESQA